MKCKSCWINKWEDEFYEFTDSFSIDNRACKQCRLDFWKKVIENVVSKLPKIDY